MELVVAIGSEVIGATIFAWVIGNLVRLCCDVFSTDWTCFARWFPPSHAVCINADENKTVETVRGVGRCDAVLSWVPVGGKS